MDYRNPNYSTIHCAVEHNDENDLHRVKRFIDFMIDPMRSYDFKYSYGCFTAPNLFHFEVTASEYNMSELFKHLDILKPSTYHVWPADKCNKDSINEL